VEQWTSHFMIGSLQAGDYNLVILSALTTDTGLYYCVKDDQNEPVVFINLTVLAGIYFSTHFSSVSGHFSSRLPTVSLHNAHRDEHLSSPIEM